MWQIVAPFSTSQRLHPCLIAPSTKQGLQERSPAAEHPGRRFLTGDKTNGTVATNIKTIACTMIIGSKIHAPVRDPFLT